LTGFGFHVYSALRALNYHETNLSNAYGSHISWQNADSPMPNEM
jgi:hypothetical protein